MTKADNKSWTEIPNPPYQWINTIQRIFKANSHLPLLNGDSIYITSDYSGQHKESKYEVISILYTDIENSKFWLYNQNYMRKHVLTDGRRLSFKGMNDQKKIKCLIPFLKASYQINGVLLTVAVNKKVRNLCCDIQTFSRTAELLSLKGNWKVDDFNRMLFIVNLVSILMCGLGEINQNIYWITDNDDFTANTSRMDDLKKIIEKITTAYIKHPLGELGVGTTNIDPGDRIEEDLTAIADLSAGAVSELLNGISKKYGKIPKNLTTPFDNTLSAKTDILLDWYFSKSDKLLKELIVFEDEGGAYSVFKFDKWNASKYDII